MLVNKSIQVDHLFLGTGCMAHKVMVGKEQPLVVPSVFLYIGTMDLQLVLVDKYKLVCGYSQGTQPMLRMFLDKGPHI